MIATQTSEYTDFIIKILCARVFRPGEPVTWSLAYRGAMRQARLAALEPALRLIRERYAKDPQTQMQQTMALYRQHGLSVVDSKSMLGTFVQMPVIYGLYRTLSNGVGTCAFLWIRNLARPDVALRRAIRRNSTH